MYKQFGSISVNNCSADIYPINTNSMFWNFGLRLNIQSQLLILLIQFLGKCRLTKKPEGYYFNHISSLYVYITNNVTVSYQPVIKKK